MICASLLCAYDVLVCVMTHHWKPRENFELALLFTNTKFFLHLLHGLYFLLHSIPRSSPQLTLTNTVMCSVHVGHQPTKIQIIKKILCSKHPDNLCDDSKGFEQVGGQVMSGVKWHWSSRDERGYVAAFAFARNISYS